MTIDLTGLVFSLIVFSVHMQKHHKKTPQSKLSDFDLIIIRQILKDRIISSTATRELALIKVLEDIVERLGDKE